MKSLKGRSGSFVTIVAVLVWKFDIFRLEFFRPWETLFHVKKTLDPNSNFSLISHDFATYFATHFCGFAANFMELSWMPKEKYVKISCSLLARSRCTESDKKSAKKRSKLLQGQRWTILTGFCHAFKLRSILLFSKISKHIKTQKKLKEAICLHSKVDIKCAKNKVMLLFIKFLSIFVHFLAFTKLKQTWNWFQNS